jgi:endonuclease YncB( thermonuclease family)
MSRNPEGPITTTGQGAGKVMRLAILAAAFCASVLADSAFAKQQKPVAADEPAPPKAVPVQSVDAAPLLPVGATTTEGTPLAVTGDTLQLGDKTVRLYGIAAPDIRANHGADARVALDQLIAQRRVQCSEFDRTKDGLVIAACKADNDDLAEQMLLSGYAAVYRSQINPTQQELDLAKRYDIAEAKARVEHLGLWALPPKAEPAADAPNPMPEPWVTRPMLQSWIVAAPILLIVLIALTLYGRARGRQWREERRLTRLTSTSLLAQILAEVLSIREAAAEQIGHLASLPQEDPVPTTRLALMGLPPALIYAANAGQLYRLPRDTGVDLVQFYAAYAGIGMMLKQAAHLRVDGLRHAYIKIVEAADLVLERGQKQLG